MAESLLLLFLTFFFLFCFLVRLWKELPVEHNNNKYLSFVWNVAYLRMKSSSLRRDLGWQRK
ncbi:MAG: hypothetical protein DRN92_05680 [Thermoproteota archaeon]|nr:MAG: hypothetical protein DRN92_05680 [Candidatus Korarchaeota archaeon]